MKAFSLVMACYISLGALFPGGDFSQLLRMNDLMTHFELHKEEAAECGESISFLDFLSMHYSGNQDHQHDGESDHGKLPLKICSASSAFIVGIPVSPMDQPVNDFYKVTFYNIAFLSQFFTDGVFRPPSIA